MLTSSFARMLSICWGENGLVPELSVLRWEQCGASFGTAIRSLLVTVVYVAWKCNIRYLHKSLELFATTNQQCVWTQLIQFTVGRKFT
jgi:hypothetical protein